MKSQFIHRISVTWKTFLRTFKSRFFVFQIAVASLAFLFSCQKDEKTNIQLAGDLAITTNGSAVVLNQRNEQNTALTYHWTTGTNNGTGASIAYVLQIDKQGNNFANPLSFEMGKAVYEKSFKVSELNQSLLSSFGLQPNIQATIEARIVATISTNPVTNVTSPPISFSVTPYEPVSTTLFLIGDATSIAWDVTKAIPLTRDVNNTANFAYRGEFVPGSYEFITTLGQALPAYVRGNDDNHIIYRTADGQPDTKFAITEAGVYKISVNLLDLTITAVKVDLPAYENIYIIGSSTPVAWDIANAPVLVQNADNPYIFTYSGVMVPGEFKFPVNRNADWGQDMYMKTSDSTMYLHRGGNPDDNKWTIAKKGYYIITLNLLDLTVSIERTKLFFVGSATPIAWTITSAIELSEDVTDGCIFTYTGPMVAGEFKFPVNRNSDWGQDMYERIDDTHMYRHHGGDPDDNKWNIVNPGDYVITANIETLTISIGSKK